MITHETLERYRNDALYHDFVNRMAGLINDPRRPFTMEEIRQAIDLAEEVASRRLPIRRTAREIDHHDVPFIGNNRNPGEK